jgi:hypothetical protein
MAGEDMIRMSVRELRRLQVVRKTMEKEITQRAAAALLDLSERQVRRLVKVVRELGDGGIVHGSRGRPSNRRLPEKVKERVVKLYRRQYHDFGPTLASEKLLEVDSIDLSRETLRQWLLAAGLWTKRRRRRDHRQWRPRKECFGAMIQLDGSHHAWLEGRGPELVLMGYIDDATGMVYGRFYDYEGTIPAMDSFKRYVRKYGLPMSVYLDKHTTYRSQRRLTVEEEVAGQVQPLSQFERALEELGVEVIHAHSPQAKGRVERLFGTLQDRLVKEMRLAGIATQKAANAFLRDYLPRYNRRFRVPPANSTDVHVKLPRGFSLDRYLCIKTERTVKRDHTVAHKTKLYQLTPPVLSRKVVVEEWINGSVHIVTTDGHKLKYRTIAAPRPPATPPPRPSPPRTPSLPASDHPWRKSRLKTLMRKAMYTQTTK